MFKDKSPICLAIFLLYFFLAALVGCGGGGDAASNPDGGNSTVALFLADGPADAFDHIWIEVTEVSLLPEGEGAPVVIYETDTPTQLDLLALQDDDLLLTVNSEVPTGRYSKIRLTVDSVVGQQGDQMIDFHLASQKIDLNPKGTIDVSEGETLSLRLDIDADKSIHMAGPNYNFRPVVFVEAGPIKDPRRCHHLIKGEITDLLYADKESKDVIGFRMAPFFGLASLNVHLQDNVLIFDEAGQSSGPEALAVDQMIGVKGSLEPNGRIMADMVVIGEVQDLYGEVQSPVNENQFLLRPGYHWDDHILPPTPMPIPSGMPIYAYKTVALSDGTLIMMAGNEATPDHIVPSLRAHVIGQFNDAGSVMNAIAVYLKSRPVGGILTAIEPTEGGQLLTIMSHLIPPYDPPIEKEPEEGEEDGINKPNCFAGTEIVVFLPDTAPINVKDGPESTIDALKAMLECHTLPRVQVTLDTSVEIEGAQHASELTVWPGMVKIIVESVDVANRVITGRTGYAATEGGTIQVTVPEGTPIWTHRGEAQELITLENIQKEDHLLVVAMLTVCEPKAYEAVTIVKMPGCVPPDPPCKPEYEKIDMQVAQVEVDEGGTSGAIEGTNGTLVMVTQRTEMVDQTQKPPVKMSLADIQEGDTLICKIEIDCTDGPPQAVHVARVYPDDEPIPIDDCMPYEVKKEVMIETIDLEKRIILTTDEETVLVPDDASIHVLEQKQEERLTLEDLKPGDVLEINAKQSCKDDADWIAYMIIKQLPAASRIGIE